MPLRKEPMENVFHKTRWTYFVTFMSRKHGCPSPKGGQASIPDRDRTTSRKITSRAQLAFEFFEDVNLSLFCWNFDCLFLFFLTLCLLCDLFIHFSTLDL